MFEAAAAACFTAAAVTWFGLAAGLVVVGVALAYFAQLV